MHLNFNFFMKIAMNPNVTVSKNRNGFMKTSFLPKTNARAEILKIIELLFGRNDIFIKSFWLLLTFSSI